MALKTRGGNVYCYRSVRRGGRVASEYLGAGSAAVLAELQAERERAMLRASREAGRAADAAMVTRFGRVGRLVARLATRVDGPFGDAMTYLGYYRHHRQWRRRGKMDRIHPGSRAFEDARQAEKARRLFEAADDVPALIERLGGGLAGRVRERLIARFSDDALVRESLRREAGMLRRSLEGESPTAVERLVAERAVAGWLAVHYYELLNAGRAGDFESREVAAHVARMLGSANRGYLAALRSLALVQRAIPAANCGSGTAREAGGP